jgi:superfamily I DNA/RNA helicase
VLDEAQDISMLYYKLVVKMTTDRALPFLLMLLGDYKQSLYEFKGSDTRFLTRADTHWRHHPYIVSKRFEACTLQTSYRITIPMAHFVNRVMLGEERVEAVKEGVPVMYVRGDYRRIKNLVSTRIQELIRMGESPGDIFVLAGGTKRSGSLIREIENVLVESNIPCYIPSISESEKIDPKIIDRKVVFTTFHSVKGRQRKYVFVADFNQQYFKIHGRTLPIDQCPNTLYVGCTRATKELYLLELSRYSTDRPLDFLKYNMVELAKLDYVDFKGIPQMIFPPEREKPADEIESVCNVSPTEIVSFIGDTILTVITPLIDAVFVKECEAKSAEESAEIPSMIQTTAGNYEDVSDLNGIAIPSMYFDHLSLHYMDGIILV